jgi:hypothetical protein
VLAVAVLGALGGALGRPYLGWVAALLLAVSPVHVWYSREARMYGPASLAWALALLGYVEVLRHGRWRDALLLAASLLAGLYLTYSTLALWVLQAGGVALAWHLAGSCRRHLRRWGLAQGLVALGILPLLPLLVRQIARPTVFHWQWPAALSARLPILARLGLSLTLAQTLELGLAAGAFVSLLLAGFSVWLVRHPGRMAVARGHGTGLAVAVVAVFALAGALGAFPRGLSVRRQLLVFWPLATLAAAWALERLNRPWLTTSLAALLVLGSLPAVFGPPYEDWRGAAVLVARQAAAGDVTAFYPPYGMLAAEYYDFGRASLTGVDPLTDPTTVAVPPLGGRLWLIVLQPDRQDPSGAVRAWFGSRGRANGAWFFSRIAVYAYGGR